MAIDEDNAQQLLSEWEQVAIDFTGEDGPDSFRTAMKKRLHNQVDEIGLLRERLCEKEEEIADLRAELGKAQGSEIERVFGELSKAKKRPDVMTFPWMVEHALFNATEQYSGFNSDHESYAVLLEQLDMVWDIVKAHSHGTVTDKTERTLLVTMLAKVGAMAQGWAENGGYVD